MVERIPARRPASTTSIRWTRCSRSSRATSGIVASGWTLSVGSPRPFRLRPRGGGPSLSWNLGHGDLFVMGGACQHNWEHTVPKVRVTTGPRLSITFRNV